MNEALDFPAASLFPKYRNFLKIIHQVIHPHKIVHLKTARHKEFSSTISSNGKTGSNTSTSYKYCTDPATERLYKYKK